MLRETETEGRQTRGQSVSRRKVYGVILCLGPVSERTVIDRCHRYHGMSAFEVEQALQELFNLGIVESVGKNLAENRLWQLTAPPASRRTEPAGLRIKEWGVDNDAASE